MDELCAFFESLASEWDAQQPPDRTTLLNRLLTPFAQVFENAKAILEVGTGTGALIPCLQGWATTANLVSIDLAGEMLRHARQRCPEAIVAQADVHHLPFVMPGFDLVVCHNSFPHFVDKPAALLNLWCALQPGGHLLILHDLGREQVNAIHQGARASVIHNDLLPAGVETRQMLIQAGFSDAQVWDAEDRYVAVASRIEED
jgi:ubiquinone/menaquinone biosynthesis C-methylase UbiE